MNKSVIFGWAFCELIVLLLLSPISGLLAMLMYLTIFVIVEIFFSQEGKKLQASEDERIKELEINNLTRNEDIRLMALLKYDNKVEILRILSKYSVREYYFVARASSHKYNSYDNYNSLKHFVTTKALVAIGFLACIWIYGIHNFYVDTFTSWWSYGFWLFRITAAESGNWWTIFYWLVLTILVLPMVFVLPSVFIFYTGVDDPSISMELEKPALIAVQKDGLALQNLHKTLQNYRKVALEAVKQNRQAIIYVSSELLNDRCFILELTQNDHKILEYIKSIELWDRYHFEDDLEILLTALCSDNSLFILKCATRELRDDFLNRILGYT